MLNMAKMFCCSIDANQFFNKKSKFQEVALSRSKNATTPCQTSMVEGF